MRRFRATAGLSVLEILVAITVVAIAGLGLIAALTRLMFAQSSSSHQTVGRLLAVSKLEEAVLAGPPHWGRDPAGAPQVVSMLVGQGVDPTEFTLQIEPVELPKGAAIAAGIPMGDLWEVKVTASWQGGDEDNVAGTEKGRRSLTVSKVTYLED